MSTGEGGDADGGGDGKCIAVEIKIVTLFN